ncbi:MAG: glutathione peroxidase [Bacteroidota bacterium]
MKTLFAFCLLIAFTACGQSKNAQNEKNSTMNTPKESIHQYTVTDIDGKSFDFKSLKGKKIMVVNTASKCGLTPQYEKLEAIYQKYKNSNFIIVGFPANNFKGQEPGSNDEIATFCKKNYGVSFSMMEKISVKGSDIHPVYQFLTEKSKNGLEDNSVQWNFQKYLIDENGYLIKVISPRTSPDDQEITSWIEGK